MSIMVRYCLIALFPLLLASFTTLASARTLGEIRNSGELRICTSGVSASFYQKNGEAFARYLKLSSRVTKLADWDQQFHNDSGTTVKEARYESQLLADGSCDVFPNDLHIVDWRQSKMLLVPYYKTRKMIVANKDMRGVLKQEADLEGHIAAVQQGTAYESWIVEKNQTQFRNRPVIVQRANTEQSMKLVAERKADFTVIGAEGAFKWVRRDLEDLDMLFPVGKIVEVGWGVSLSAPDLAEQLHAFFADSLRIGSSLDRSWANYYDISLLEYRLFESSIDYVEAQHKKLLALGGLLLAGLGGVAFAAFFWIRKLKKEVNTRRQKESELRKSEEHFRMLAENMNDLVWKTDREFRMTYVNKADSLLRGFARDEVIGRKFGDMLTPEGKDILASAMIKRREMIASGVGSQVMRFDVPLQKKDGGEVWIEIHSTPTYDLDENISGYQGIGRDITTRRQAELRQQNEYRVLSSQLAEVFEVKEHLEQEAMCDPLTGLYNRRHMEKMLTSELARAKRNAYPLALVMIDIDHFKKVNDTYGHATGDEVIRVLSSMLKNGMRESDLAFRYGGEEFLVAMPQISCDQAMHRVDGWRAAFAKTEITYDEATMTATLSAGIASFPEDGESIDRLVSCADKMLYRSKSNGRNRVTTPSA